MIETRLLEELARKNQTSRINVSREYCQNLFLAQCYKQKGTERILFKGGTALRILWQSPRFSEDLDFSGSTVTQKTIEDIIQTTLIEVKREGLEVSIQESKKTSGGYLGILLFRLPEVGIPIKIEISMRKRRHPERYEQTLVTNDFIPPYTVLHLPQEEIVEEKVNALLSRAKPRDYFDLYFILRNRMAIQKIFRRDKTLLDKILRQLRKTETSFSRELKQFLPTSHQVLLRNFQKSLENELLKV